MPNHASGARASATAAGAALFLCQAACGGLAGDAAFDGGPAQEGAVGASRPPTCPVDATSSMGARTIDTLARTKDVPVGLVANDLGLFWGDYFAGGGGVMFAPRSGDPPTALSTGRIFIDSLAVNATTVFFTDQAASSGEIEQVPISGGATTTFSTYAYPESLALDSEYLYWIGYDAPAILRQPLGGGAATTLVHQPSGSEGPYHLMVDDTNLYWMFDAGSSTPAVSLMKAPKAGGAPVTLVGPAGTPWKFALDGAAIYWTEKTGGSIVKLPLAGGSRVTLASGRDSPAEIAVDDARVYWTEGRRVSGSVVSVSKCGGAPTTLASGQVYLGELAVDETSVYFTAGGVRGTVNRIQPK